MTKYYNFLDQQSKKQILSAFEVRRHRKYMANKKWKTIGSYQSLKDIPEDAIEYRQKYNKYIGPILRMLRVNLNKDWYLVKSEIYKEMKRHKADLKEVDFLLSQFVLEDVYMLREAPYILRGNNYYKINKSGNTFYIDEYNILREPKEEKMYIEFDKIKANNNNEWYVLKKDDNTWYRVIIKDSKGKTNHPTKEWIKEYFSQNELRRKVVTVSSLSKKEKRNLLKSL